VRSIFYEQVDRFWSEFDDSGRWISKKDQKNDIITLIPPEWIIHSQHNGISLQFTLNVKGELCLSVSVGLIALENRADFKSDLHAVLRDRKLLDTTFKDFDSN